MVLIKALEGDIESAYPKVVDDILIKVLGERIKDSKLLFFVKREIKT